MIRAVSRLLRTLGLGAQSRAPIPELPPEVVRARIAASDLFDSEFYLATYGANVSGSNPLLHFLETGLACGYLPSAQFDPVLYRLTVPSCGQSNPLLHYLEHGRGRRLVNLAEVFPDLLLKYAKKNRSPDGNKQPSRDEVDRYVSNLAAVGQEQDIRFAVDGQEYTIEVPGMDFFLGRLREDRPFAFARLPHGFWDALVTRDAIAADRRLAPLAPRERLALAARIAQEALPHHGGFSEALMEEMSEAIVRHRKNPDFFSAVAFKGFFDAPDGLFRPKMPDSQRVMRLDLYRGYFGPADRVLDAAVWKRFADTGQLWALADACHERHVVLLGPEYLRDLGRRWNLQRFTHVEIATNRSQRERWDILVRLKHAIDAAAREPGPRPVLLTMCGGSFAYWLFSALFAWRRDVFYIDLGQSIRIWFPDVDTNSPWMNIYLTAQRQLKENPGDGQG